MATKRTARDPRELLRERAIREFLSVEEEQAWFGLLETYARLVTALDEELIDRHAISLSVYETLVRIAHAPGSDISIADLAGHVRLSPSRTSRLVIGLERKGLVRRERDPSDARSTRTAITAQGIDRLREVAPTYLGALRRLLFDVLSESDVEQLGSIWQRVAGDPPARARPPAPAA